MPADAGPKAVHGVAAQYARSGQWVMAREAYGLLLDRYPAHPLAAEAARWLVRYHSSGEARRRHELGQFLEITKAETETDPKTGEGGIVAASAKFHPEGTGESVAWLKGSLELEKRLADYGAGFLSDPATQLCLASARRQLGKGDEADKWLQHYLADTAVPNGGPSVGRGSDPFRECATVESWLIRRGAGALPPRPLGAAVVAKERPKLDGKFDEVFWKSAVPLVLSTTAGELGDDYASQVLVAYDDEYLYFAVNVGTRRGRAPAVSKRQRDADLKLRPGRNHARHRPRLPNLLPIPDRPARLPRG